MIEKQEKSLIMTQLYFDRDLRTQSRSYVQVTIIAVTFAISWRFGR